mmetsp:Transcript_29178/g.38368  ORF Transcript_29178/g.38368 Transcript_29178/m.38368 type:complete len:196 (-) Transcript_29178:387-974(-)
MLTQVPRSFSFSRSIRPFSGLKRLNYQFITATAKPFSNVAAEIMGAMRTANDAWNRSCYHNIDFKVDESATVYEAIEKFSAYDVGCLLATKDGEITGLVSERDYVCKIALLGRNSKETKVREIMTSRKNLLIGKRGDPLELCMSKMVKADIRHLPLEEDDGSSIYGLISVKDVVKEYAAEQDDVIMRLTDFLPKA